MCSRRSGSCRLSGTKNIHNNYMLKSYRTIQKLLSFEAKILFFIQFQIIGITISKYGLDSLVFAKMIGDTNSVYDSLEYIKKKGILLSILCAGVYAIMYDYTYALVIFCTIVLDVYSVMTIEIGRAHV